MADTAETTEDRTLTLEEKRIADLSERLENSLYEGEEYIVRRVDGEVQVVPAQDGNRFPKTHEDLYGRLLSVNQQIVDAGASVLWFMRLAVPSAIVVLELGLVDQVAGIPVQNLQSLWLYLLLFLFGVAVNSIIRDLFVHWAYARRRTGLMQAIDASDLGRYRLLSQIEYDDSLGAVSRMLKKEHENELRY